MARALRLLPLTLPLRGPLVGPLRGPTPQGERDSVNRVFGRASVAPHGVRVVRLLPLTLPHRAPFLPAKMGTRRGPRVGPLRGPTPQGERVQLFESVLFSGRK